MFTDKNGKISSKRIGSFLLYLVSGFVSVWITVNSIPELIPLVAVLSGFGAGLNASTLGEKKG